MVINNVKQFKRELRALSGLAGRSPDNRHPFLPYIICHGRMAVATDGYVFGMASLTSAEFDEVTAIPARIVSKIPTDLNSIQVTSEGISSADGSVTYYSWPKPGAVGQPLALYEQLHGYTQDENWANVKIMFDLSSLKSMRRYDSNFEVVTLTPWRQSEDWRLTGVQLEFAPDGPTLHFGAWTWGLDSPPIYVKPKFLFKCVPLLERVGETFPTFYTRTGGELLYPLIAFGNNYLFAVMPRSRKGI